MAATKWKHLDQPTAILTASYRLAMAKGWTEAPHQQATRAELKRRGVDVTALTPHDAYAVMVAQNAV